MEKQGNSFNEKNRIKELKALKILETPEEERFDRLTRMARKIYNVPIALISLVDENRQWFKSHNGLDFQESPRENSFCNWTIQGDDIFMVDDALRDERFKDNSFVVNHPFIRFYAGHPLKNLKGYNLGTFCIMDTKARQLNPDEKLLFRDLANLARQELAGIQLATLDELTGLTNRRGFMVLSRHSLNIARRHKIPSVLIFMDLNKFKSINDNFGHGEGDRALRTFSSVMKEVFRDSDLFARLGGDEFVALLSNTTVESANTVMDRFKRDIDLLNSQSGRGYEILFSFGVVAFNPDIFNDIDELLAEGDRLMYVHKRKSRE